MGLFGKTGQCSVCGQNEGSKKLMDGYICKNCMKRTEPFIITLSWKNYTTDRVKHAIAEADRNAQLFHRDFITETVLPLLQTESVLRFILMGQQAVRFCCSVRRRSSRTQN